MTKGKWLLPLLAILLMPSMVSADIELQGDIAAATITVQGEVTSVDYDGHAVFAQHDGYAIVSIFDATEHQSVTIHGNVESFTVDVAVDADANAIELNIAEDILPQPTQNPDDGGTSVADMNMEADIAEYNASHGWMKDLPF